MLRLACSGVRQLRIRSYKSNGTNVTATVIYPSMAEGRMAAKPLHTKLGRVADAETKYLERIDDARSEPIGSQFASPSKTTNLVPPELTFNTTASTFNSAALTSTSSTRSASAKQATCSKNVCATASVLGNLLACMLQHICTLYKPLRIRAVLRRLSTKCSETRSQGNVPKATFPNEMLPMKCSDSSSTVPKAEIRQQGSTSSVVEATCNLVFRKQCSETRALEQFTMIRSRCTLIHAHCTERLARTDAPSLRNVLRT